MQAPPAPCQLPPRAGACNGGRASSCGAGKPAHHAPRQRPLTRRCSALLSPITANWGAICFLHRCPEVEAARGVAPILVIPVGGAILRQGSGTQGAPHVVEGCGHVGVLLRSRATWRQQRRQLAANAGAAARRPASASHLPLIRPYRTGRGWISDELPRPHCPWALDALVLRAWASAPSLQLPRLRAGQQCGGHQEQPASCKRRLCRSHAERVR